MKTFRQKFTENHFFYPLVALYLVSILAVINIFHPDNCNSYIGIAVACWLFFVVLYTGLVIIHACNYMIITDAKVIIRNPYTHRHDELYLNNIERITIMHGGAHGDKSILFQTTDGEKLKYVISLVRNHDIKEIIEIFKDNNIDAETNLIAD